MATDLARKLSLLALRGAGLLFGIIAVMWLLATLAVLVFVFSAFVSRMASLP